MTALFIMAQVLKFMGRIGDYPWLIASLVGVFGFVVVRAWLQSKYASEGK
jgi:uncharacterized membrane protein